jgi:NAD(P)-dependent dehydrogenase (short-subunit alcohol dehydrogenase family)
MHLAEDSCYTGRELAMPNPENLIPDRLFDLTGKVAIVTGAARGNGYAIARGFAHSRASVIMADVLDEQLADSASKITNAGHTAIPITIDLTRPEQINHLVEEAIVKYGRIDILVNCAGVTFGAPSEDYPEELWNRTLEINLLAIFRLTKLVAQQMIKQKSGSIINITSIGAVLGFPNNPAYQASKGALQQLTRAWACDWAKYNIRVNNLCPGYFHTAMTAKSYANPDIRRMRASRCMLNRWGNPDELIGPAIFLASDASSYMTGSDLFIDGGWVRTGLGEGQ